MKWTVRDLVRLWMARITLHLCLSLNVIFIELIDWLETCMRSAGSKQEEAIRVEDKGAQSVELFSNFVCSG